LDSKGLFTYAVTLFVERRYLIMTALIVSEASTYLFGQLSWLPFLSHLGE